MPQFVEINTPDPLPFTTDIWFSMERYEVAKLAQQLITSLTATQETQIPLAFRSSHDENGDTVRVEVRGLGAFSPKGYVTQAGVWLDRTIPNAE